MNEIKYHAQATKNLARLTMTRPVSKNGNEAVYFRLLRCIILHPFHTQNEYNHMIGVNHYKEGRWNNSVFQALSLYGLVKTSYKYGYIATEKGMEFFIKNEK